MSKKQEAGFVKEKRPPLIKRHIFFFLKLGHPTKFLMINDQI